MRMTAIGRERQLRLLTEAMVADAMVALVGPSGIGKSVIAATWAEARERALFVDCFGLDAADVLRALAEAMGLQDVESARESSVWGKLCVRLVSYDAVVLDDYGSEPRLLVELRNRTRLPLLVTAQAIPDVEGVDVLPVEPFEVPELADFEGSVAHTLFVQTACDVDLRYESDDPATTHAIVTATGGYPLGIALAARRAATFGAAEVLRLMTLDDRATTDPRRPVRHQTLGNAVAFSWQQLDEDHRRRMFAMAVFARPLRPALIAVICDEDLADILDAIADLARRGFVTRGPFPRPLEVFVDIAREAFGEESPEAASALRARIRRLAVEEAAELPRGLAAPSRFHEGPSLWQYLLDSEELDLLQPAELGAVLAAWAKWLRLAPRDDRRALERITLHLERANDWNAWLASARTSVANDAARALELAGRASEAAETDQELREALDLSGHCLAMGLRHAEAGEVFARSAGYGQNTALTAYYRARFYNDRGNAESARRCSMRRGSWSTRTTKHFARSSRFRVAGARSLRQTRWRASASPSSFSPTSA